MLFDPYILLLQHLSLLLLLLVYQLFLCALPLLPPAVLLDHNNPLIWRSCQLLLLIVCPTSQKCPIFC